VNEKKSEAGKIAFVLGGGISALIVLVFCLVISFIKRDFSITPPGLRVAIAFMALSVVIAYVIAKLKDL